MSITTSVYIATSLDGFISGPDGSIDWLHQANPTVPPGEDCGYAKFMATVDVLVMGRNTYEQVITFDPWPYADRKVVVLSTRQVTVPAHLESCVMTSSEAPAALLDRLGKEGARHVYVDGGKTIQGFLAGGLIHQITITVIPVLLGSGRSLFAIDSKEQKLRLVSSKAYEFGFVQSTYRVLADANPSIDGTLRRLRLLSVPHVKIYTTRPFVRGTPFATAKLKTAVGLSLCR